MINICSGAISGLIAITPAAGYVGARESVPKRRNLRTNPASTAAAVLIGVVAAITCYFAADLLYWLQVDDLMDVSSFSHLGKRVDLSGSV